MDPLSGAESLFLGLDSSTQGLKAVAIDSRLRVVHKAAVNFDADFPEFRTEGGVHRQADGLTVTSPALLWVAALDRMLEQLRGSRGLLPRVAAVSASGQQHGSVWFRKGARAALGATEASATLRERLAGAFALADSPIWMDASTQRECLEREAALGGPQALAEITGSRAYERFTGNQIAKIRRTRPGVYEETERIALVSSFVASLLSGDYAPIDTSDGSGMNLLDIRRKAWDERALACTAPGLGARLGAPVAAHSVVGRVHPYHVARHGFAPACLVVASSGDNPCSLAGLRLQSPGDIAVSLGTSDTLFGSLVDPRPSGAEGHVFVNPIDPAAYMAMVVRTNGSLTREHVRDACAGGTWDAFNAALGARPPANAGCLGLYIRVPEITPPLLRTGNWRWDGAGRAVERFDAATEVRALIEGQFLSLRLHGERIGIRPQAVLATGGASSNPAILRVLCDVFGVPVFTADQPDSAALGAAARALHGWLCARRAAFVPFAEATAGAAPFARAAEPDAAAHAAYTALAARFAACEAQAAG